FTGQLTFSDPLQTLFQLLSGKTPTVSTVYKLLYATRLLDWGLSSQAFHYCELIGQSILRHHEPLPVLTGEVIKLSDRLKLWECQLDDASCGGATRDPHWLQQLRLRLQGSQAGNDGDCAGAYLPPVDGRTLANQDTDLSAPAPCRTSFRIQLGSLFRIGPFAVSR
ncbi:hypothetical protein CRUP_001791, partial [Coryphaenoides rupestris]